MLIFHIFTKIVLVNQAIDEKGVENVVNKKTFIVDFLSIYLFLLLLLIFSNMTQKEKKSFLHRRFFHR
jgi:preprotein translocase subunit SecG